jgi:hypothetical protein
VRERRVRPVERLDLEPDAAAALSQLPRQEAANVDVPLAEQLCEPRYDRRLPRAGPPFDEDSQVTVTDPTSVSRLREQA